MKRHLIAVTAFFLLISCSAHKKKAFIDEVKPEKTAFMRMEKEIRDHGSIPYYNEDGTYSRKELQRSLLGTNSPADLKMINEYLAELDSTYMKENSFMAINYYPGEDECNTTGSITRAEVGRRNKKYNKHIEEKVGLTQMNLYKSDIGIERWNKNRVWVEDMNLIIGNYFFQNHYPCSSFVILHESGRFYYYFGENWHKKKMLDIDLFIEIVEKGQF